MEVTFLGGCEEIGANSSFYNIADTGIIIDAGLHPNKRNEEAFPLIDKIIDKNVDLILLTHAHTDHIGGLPYILKYFPHLKILTHKATADLLELMIKDLSKILKTNIINQFDTEILSLYQPEIIEKIRIITDTTIFNNWAEYIGKRGKKPIKIKLMPAGHILGASSILLDIEGKTILHTGDINFNNQFVLKGAELVNHHIDTLIIESTNCNNESTKNLTDEIKSFTTFVNKIVDANGSILIPAFSLGKTQEILKLIFNLMKKGSIPNIPIYNGGLSTKISRLYDIYNYTTPRIRPGFEINDIPHIKLNQFTMHEAKYLKEPSIVVTGNGMLMNGTKSYNLSKEWFKRKNFGIALVGYQAPGSPGFELSQSESNTEFNYANNKIKRICDLMSFRFSLHSDFNSITNYISQIKPSNLFIIHGDIESCEYLANYAMRDLNIKRVVIPENGKTYQLFK